MPRRSRRAIPKHRSEEQERAFWARADSADHVDWKSASRVSFARLRPSTRTISLRLPEALVADLKVLANKQDVPYQSLLKIYVAERIRLEFGRLGRAG